MQVIYEDNHLIGVYKPAGMLVQGDETGDLCLMDEVKAYLKNKYAKKGNVFLGLLHRLDRPVSGIVLFAKTSKGASRLSEQFRNHSITKIYHAIVEGVLTQKSGTLINWIEKNEEKNVVSIFDKEKKGSSRAELDYEVVETSKDTSLIKIFLKTGRPHQIRAQFSHIGHPIVGDLKYGAKKSLSDKSISLCATSLTFKTATGDIEKTISVEPLFKI